MRRAAGRNEAAVPPGRNGLKSVMLKAAARRNGAALPPG